MESSDSQFKFSAKLYNVKPLVNVLKTIDFPEKALVEIDKEGLFFSVQTAQIVVAKAYLKRDFFSEYSVSNMSESSQAEIDSQNHEEPLEFSIYVGNLVECLTLFFGPGTSASSSGAITANDSTNSIKSSTTVQFAYDGEGTDFELMLEDNGVISICRLTTFEPAMISDLGFKNDSEMQSVILKSEWLQDAFEDIDIGGDNIMFTISKSSPILKLTSFSNSGSTEIKYLNNDNLLESYECTQEQSSRFNLSMILKCRNALNLSEKTKISINKSGFLLFQFKIASNTSPSFVSFTFAPLVSD